MSPDLKSIPIVILAGGQSRRMYGVDKPTLSMGSARLIDIIYDKIYMQAGPVFVSGPQSYDLRVEVIPDVVSGPKGPVAGLFATSRHMPKTVEGFFTVPADGPNVPSDLCTRLYASTSSVIASDGDRTHPVYGWWRRQDLQSFWDGADFSQSISLQSLCDTIEAQTEIWPNAKAKKLFFNINTPAELEAYRRQ